MEGNITHLTILFALGEEKAKYSLLSVTTFFRCYFYLAESCNTLVIADPFNPEVNIYDLLSLSACSLSEPTFIISNTYTEEYWP